jgi:hypothetical protein
MTELQGCLLMLGSVGVIALAVYQYIEPESALQCIRICKRERKDRARKFQLKTDLIELLEKDNAIYYEVAKVARKVQSTQIEEHLFLHHKKRGSK